MKYLSQCNVLGAIERNVEKDPPASRKYGQELQKLLVLHKKMSDVRQKWSYWSAILCARLGRYDASKERMHLSVLSDLGSA
jgi:hypothetical protein